MALNDSDVLIDEPIPTKPIQTIKFNGMVWYTKIGEDGKVRLVFQEPPGGIDTVIRLDEDNAAHLEQHPASDMLEPDQLIDLVTFLRELTKDFFEYQATLDT